MKPVTFITGNSEKVKYVEKYLGFPLEHIKLDLDEIQSLDLREVVEHKVRQAYEKVQKPVLVDDGSLSFEALNGLPGPFIKFFVEQLPLEDICRLLDGKSRKASAEVVFGYFDGITITFFEGRLEGEIAGHPAGENGWAWDKILVIDGHHMTRAELGEEEYQKTMMQLRPLPELKAFLEKE